MLFSTNNFFRQSSEVLKDKKKLLELVLIDSNVQDIVLFLNAYDYFCDFPEDFDGATIVKDLDTIRNLDAPAMVHDYEYIVNKVYKSFIKKTVADIEYAQHMEQLGNSSVTAYFRAILLILSTPFYYLIKLFK